MLTFRDVYSAYRKLKSYSYNDHSNHALRISLAELEASGDLWAVLKSLCEGINIYCSTGAMTPYLQDKLDKITYSILPKAFSENEKNVDAKLITTKRTIEDAKLKSLIYSISCPVEIHLIAVLWIMKVGCQIDQEFSQDIYANRLSRDEDGDWNNYSVNLFKPYYHNYQSWRDGALSAARAIHNERQSSTIFSLDIREYFYSIDFSFEKLDLGFQNSQAYVKYVYLNKLVDLVHEAYANKLGIKTKTLPIGLLSSGILANAVLHSFDIEVKQSINPVYYGRYVDDMLIVVPGLDLNLADVKESLRNLFIKRGVLKANPVNSKSMDSNALEFNFSNSFGTFYLQSSKIKIFHLDKSSSLALLDEFEKNLQKTASEARLLTEDSDVLSRFSSESFNLSYSEGVFKFRSVDKFDLNKWGISSFLNNLIESSKVSAKIDSEVMASLHNQFKTILQGRDCLDQFRLWEKIFSFYTVNERSENLDEMIIRIMKSINGISMVPLSEIAPRLIPADAQTLLLVKKSLFSWVFNCLALAYSVNGGVKDWKLFVSHAGRGSDEDYSTETKFYRSIILQKELEVSIHIMNLRSSNLLRHNYCAIPLLNFADQKEDYNFSKFITKDNFPNFRFEKMKQRLSPRFVHFSEIQYFKKICSMYEPLEASQKSDVEIFEEFNLHLYGYKNRINVKSLPVEERLESEKIKYLRVKDDKRKSGDKIKIGIGNVIVQKQYTRDRLTGNQNLSFSRIRDLNHMLNLGVRERVDLLVFPELYIPFEWIDYLAKFSKRHQIAIVAGIEHFIYDHHKDGKTLVNFACVLLPFKRGDFKNINLDLIEKSNPNKVEYEICDSADFKIVEGTYTPKIYSWRNTDFAVLNCLELADIDKRAWMRGNIDLLAIVENNKDTEYFGTIVESISRDLSAYIVQVNNSAYGDSRICQPAKSFEKDILRVKGGTNATILSADILTEELRHYHYLGDAYRNFNPNLWFKPLPPCFKISPLRNPKSRPSKKSD